MPKIISELRESLLAETRRQLQEVGYAGLTMRSVAAKCGIAVGTMYNYFPSKEQLIGYLVLEDWQAVYANMENDCRTVESLDGCLRAIYVRLITFTNDHDELFSSDMSLSSKQYPYPDRHALLISQLEALLRLLCGRFPCQTDDFTFTFLAESILKCSLKPYPYESLSPILMKILT